MSHSCKHLCGEMSKLVWGSVDMCWGKCQYICWELQHLCGKVSKLREEKVVTLVSVNICVGKCQYMCMREVLILELLSKTLV